jgi:sugar lactone lactonase YvrE
MTRLALTLAAGITLAVARAAAQPAATPTAAPATSPAAALPAAALQTVARLTEGPGNLTVTPDGDVIVSLHQFFETPLRVARVRPDGRLEAFPNSEWNTPGLAGRYSFDAVLGIQCDQRGVVWMLDNGLRGKTTPKLVGWDLGENRLFRLIPLPAPITRPGSFVNDLAVDRAHDRVYIADPAGPQSALIVVDINTGDARRVLEGHPSVAPEDVDMIVDGRPVEMLQDGKPIRPRVGVNPIALDAADQWLYFGPMSGAWLYRVRTSDLIDASLPEMALAQRVERYAERPISDGISVDAENNIYVSAVTEHAVGVIGADRQYRTLVRDERLLSWPDAFSLGPNGWMYVVANQLHKTRVLNGGRHEASMPYYVLRFRALAPGVIGR